MVQSYQNGAEKEKMKILEYENYQEKKSHFDSSFPYNTYLCSIPQDFLSVPLHWHLEMEIIYIKKGCGTVAVDLNPSFVQKGDIIFIAPGQLHEITQYGHARMEYENTLFDINMLSGAANDVCSTDFLIPLQHSHTLAKNIYTPADHNYTQIARRLDDADEIRKTTPQAYQLAIKGCLFFVFYELFTGYPQGSLTKKTFHSLDALKAAIKYVEIHYQEPIRIKDIAAFCDYSESHFMKYFKNATGMSFIEYLNGYRLSMASRLLLASDAPVINIAQESGFQNLSYFNRMFKKKFGITPSAYRLRSNHMAVDV